MPTSASVGGDRAGDGERWHPALDEAELGLRPLRVVKLEGHQLVVGRDEQGQPFALDNRCPHEGYPLAQGRLDGCALTCTWHNWKFDVRDGRCILGGEAVRSYPTRVRDGRLEVDMAEPDPAQRIPQLLESLDRGVFEQDTSRAIRDGVRLLQLGFEPGRLCAHLAADDALRAEYGSSHVLALAADCARIAARFEGPRAMLAIAPVVDLAAETNRRLPARPLALPIAGASLESLREAVEAEDGARAEGLLLGAFEAGVPLELVQRWLLELVALHFTDFGHQLIYLTKLGELVERAGEERARELCVGLLRSIVLGTREDELPYMRAYFRAFAERTEELERALASASDGAPFDPSSFRRAVLDGSVRDACGALSSAAERGVPPSEIARALVLAGAERLFRFDVAIDRDPEVAESWLWATHRFTFASAVRAAVERFGGSASLRLLLQGVAFVHSGRPMDAPPEERLDPAPERASPEEVLAAIADRDAALAVARARGSMASGQVDELRRAVEDLCLADPLVRPIVLTHAIKTACAAFEEHATLAGDPARELPVLAAVRFLASPIVERRLAQTVASSIRWVVHGEMPRKLTQRV